MKWTLRSVRSHALLLRYLCILHLGSHMVEVRYRLDQLERSRSIGLIETLRRRRQVMKKALALSISLA